MTKVFIDGKDGTTGLKIFERFQHRRDIELLQIDGALRKNTAERKRLLNNADICFLCLPDAAARESVSLIENGHTAVIDTSTAHRTHPDWAYGFPELSENHRSRVLNSKRIAVPGCHASGFNSIVFPLTECGLMPVDYPVVCHSVTGYSGGGKQMIAKYDAMENDELYAPRQYALSQHHKHLPEMKSVSGLIREPVFNPILSNYYSGMTVTVPLFSHLLTKTVSVRDVYEIYREKYSGSKLVHVLPLGFEEMLPDGMIAGNALSGKDGMEILVYGNDERIMVASRFDNLGKGASGAAIQCMNIIMGVDETTGLNI